MITKSSITINIKPTSVLLQVRIAKHYSLWWCKITAWLTATAKTCGRTVAMGNTVLSSLNADFPDSCWLQLSCCSILAGLQHNGWHGLPTPMITVQPCIFMPKGFFIIPSQKSYSYPEFSRSQKIS